MPVKFDTDNLLRDVKGTFSEIVTGIIQLDGTSNLAPIQTGERYTVYVLVNNEVERAAATYPPEMGDKLLVHNLPVTMRKDRRSGKLRILSTDWRLAPAALGGDPIPANFEQLFGGEPVSVQWGGTGADLSTTGAATHFVRQASSGAAFTVGAIATTDLPTVPVTKGGTGLTTLTANNVILGNGTSNVQFVAPGTSGNVLRSNGTTWQSQQLNISDVTGTLLTVAADSGSSQPITSGNTLTIAGGTGIASVAGATDTITLNIDSTVVTLDGSQTLTNKTLTSPTINTPVISGGTIDNTVIGGTTPAHGTFKRLAAASDSSNDFVVDAGSFTLAYGADDTVAPQFTMRKARTSATAPSNISSGDNLWRLNAQGYGGGDYRDGARLQIVATEDFSSTAAGAKIELYTTPNTTTTPVLAATIGQDKSLTMNNAPVIVGTSYLGISAGSNAGNSRLWQDSSDLMLAWQTAAGLKTLPGGVFWKMITAVTTTATSEASITGGTTWGTLTIPASTAIAGTMFEFEFSGLITASAGNLRISFRLNGTLITAHQSSAITSGANRNFFHRITMKVLDTTGTSNLIVTGKYDSANGDDQTNGAVGAGNFAVGSSNTFTFFAHFDGTPSGQSVTFHTGIGKIY